MRFAGWLKIAIISSIFSLIFPPLSVLFAQSNQTLPDKLLSSIPGGAISLDLVLGLGYKRSSQLALVKSKKDLKGLELRQVTAQSGLTGVIDTSLVYVDDRMDRQPNFPAPTSNITQKVGTSFRKGFVSGQNLDASVFLNHVETKWPANATFGGVGSANISYYETQYEVGITQSLWKNGFGKATKASLAAARTRSDIIDLDVDANIGDWGEQITQVFYNAWQAQRNVDAQLERLATQRRLEKITALSLKRGTVEKADLVNVRSQVLKSEEALSEAKKALEDTWRFLVVSLSLPQEFLQIDPMKVPIKVVDYKEAGNEICSKAGPADDNISKKNAKLAAINAQIKAAEYDLVAARSIADPDLYARLAIKSNAMEEGFGTSLGDSVQLKSPQLLAMLGVKIDIGNDAAKAQIQKAATDIKQLNLQISSLKDELQISWMNGCQELKRLDSFLEKQTKVIALSLERQKLDEERFRLGRIDVGQVIIAANEVITARFNYELAQRSYATTVWSLFNLKGSLAERMKSAAQSPLLKGL